MKKIIVLLISILLTGCSATKDLFGIAPSASGPFFTQPISASSNSVVVYVYRPSGYAYQPDVIINNVNKSLLAPGAYLVSVESTERIQIVVQKNPNTGNWNFNPIGISVNAKFGERRYFRISAGMSGFLAVPTMGATGYSTGIEEVSEAVALSEMSRTRSMR